MTHLPLFARWALIIHSECNLIAYCSVYSLLLLIACCWAHAQVVDPNTFLRADFAALDTYTPVKPFHVLAAEIGVPAEKLIKLDANEVRVCVGVIGWAGLGWVGG